MVKEASKKVETLIDNKALDKLLVPQLDIVPLTREQILGSIVQRLNELIDAHNSTIDLLKQLSDQVELLK